jgi:hypothetical protein
VNDLDLHVMQNPAHTRYTIGHFGGLSSLLRAFVAEKPSCATDPNAVVPSRPSKRNASPYLGRRSQQPRVGINGEEIVDEGLRPLLTSILYTLQVKLQYLSTDFIERLI